jgi:DNA-binding transcriptional ArsR family regulator
MPSTDVFYAISVPNRRRLIDLLAEGDKPVQELVADFDISFAAVSQHLSILRDAGLVDSYARGRQRIYRLRPTALREVDAWVARHRAFWETRLAKLRTHLARKK